MRARTRVSSRSPHRVWHAHCFTESGPATATLETPTVGASFEFDEIHALPTPQRSRGSRSWRPGLTDNTPNTGQVTVAGAFAYDNVFLIDGVDVNDNLFGEPDDLFIEDATAAAQVLVGGLPAEYGRFSGGVIKAVTKSGGNTFPGSLRTGLTDRSWTAETPFEIEEEIERESDLSQVDSATFGFRCPSDSASDRLQTVNRS